MYLRGHVLERVALARRPVDVSGLVEVLQGGAEVAAVHLAPCLLFFGTLHALNVRKDRRAVGLAQRLENPAALDARKLRVVARQNQLCARLSRGGGQLAKLLGRNHCGLVHHQNRVAVPMRAAFLKLAKLAGERVRVLEAVAAHLLHNVIRPRQAANVFALGLVNRARGFKRVALARSGLAPKDA